MNTAPICFERDDRVFLVSPVAPFVPASSEIEEYAFAKALNEIAPNPNIMWLRGQYVEADRPNANRALWTAGELAISSVTPTFMPVTVMHDPRTAVGLIADTRLLTPEKDGVPRARIDNTLGLWKHRFPQVCEEVVANYEQGALMQSMECLPTHYDCSECGQRFPKLPGGAEKANWCTHLRGDGENGLAARKLGNVCFTGTGLIFGGRGAKGAFSDAHLEVFQDEVAEFHERVHRDKRRTPRTRSSRTMEIDDKRYEELVAAESKLSETQTKLETAEEQAAKVPALESKLEETETAKVAAETTRDELKTKVEEHAETERTRELAKTRLGKLGREFVGKLGDFTRGRLEEQAGKLSDEDWDARLKELEELASLQRDAGGAGEPENEDTFSREETARTAAGSGSGNGSTGGDPSPERRQSVVAGLVKNAKGS